MAAAYVGLTFAHFVPRRSNVSSILEVWLNCQVFSGRTVFGTISDPLRNFLQKMNECLITQILCAFHSIGTINSVANASINELFPDLGIPRAQMKSAVGLHCRCRMKLGTAPLRHVPELFSVFDCGNACSWSTRYAVVY